MGKGEQVFDATCFSKACDLQKLPGLTEVIWTHRSLPASRTGQGCRT